MIRPRSLPYGWRDLEPYQSADTLRLHYLLYRRYVERTNAMTGNAFRSAASAAASAVRLGNHALYEQAAQAWSHEQYFGSMGPAGLSKEVSAPLGRALRVPGILDLEQAWVDAAMSVFGSGWVWLVLDPTNRLVIQSTKDAGLPSGVPLLTMDVWEHAFYLDYPTKKADYARMWVRNLANWSAASGRFAQATGR